MYDFITPADIAATPAKRLEWAKWAFERWVEHTRIMTPVPEPTWERLPSPEKAIWIDMVAHMEGKV